MTASSIPALLLRPLSLAIDSAPAARQRRFYLALAALAVAAWGLRAALGGTPVFPVDDAYITLHNAQALIAGHDPNYPGVPALTGATSAAHLALVAALLRLLPPLRALDVSLGLAFLAYTIGLARLAFVHRASPAQAALLVTAGVGRRPRSVPPAQRPRDRTGDGRPGLGAGPGRRSVAGPAPLAARAVRPVAVPAARVGRRLRSASRPSCLGALAELPESGGGRPRHRARSGHGGGERAALGRVVSAQHRRAVSVHHRGEAALLRGGGAAAGGQAAVGLQQHARFRRRGRSFKRRAALPAAHAPGVDRAAVLGRAGRRLLQPVPRGAAPRSAALSVRAAAVPSVRRGVMPGSSAQSVSDRRHAPGRGGGGPVAGAVSRTLARLSGRVPVHDDRAGAGRPMVPEPSPRRRCGVDPRRRLPLLRHAVPPGRLRRAEDTGQHRGPPAGDVSDRRPGPRARRAPDRPAPSPRLPGDAAAVGRDLPDHPGPAAPRLAPGDAPPRRPIPGLPAAHRRLREWLVPGRCESLEELLNAQLTSEDYEDPGTVAAAQEALGDWFPNERVFLHVRRDCRREADGTKEPWLQVAFGPPPGDVAG